MKNTFRIPVIILMLIVSAISHSASARSEVDAIEEEYNRMEAEYRTKLEQIDRNISETRNNIAEMQSDPMHSESKLDSEIKWLEILESDRVRISGTLSSLQAQKQQAIQTQINIEKGVAEAAKKAQREKQIADQQKAKQQQAEQRAAREAIEAQRKAERDARNEEERQRREEERKRLEAEFQKRYNEGIEEYDRKYGETHQRNLQYIDENAQYMDNVAENVISTGYDQTVQAQRGFRRATAGSSVADGNKPRTRSLKSIMSKTTEKTSSKSKPEVFDIDSALKGSEF
mgnify:CR=1 FL=1